jgi:hypothetical protein
MYPPRPPRDRQRGNSLLLALIVMSSLAALGSLTVVSMESGIKTSTNDRAQTIALYAAESGAAVAMDFLRANFNTTTNNPPGTAWSAYVTRSNNNVVSVPTALIPSNGVAARQPGNLFGNDQNASYDIQLFNNRDDPGFAAVSDNDTDGRIIIRVTGRGPQGALAILEWEVQRVSFWREQAGAPPPAPLAPVGPGFEQFAIFEPPPPFPWAFAPPLPVPPPSPAPPLPPLQPLAGMVLLSWHIVSL